MKTVYIPKGETVCYETLETERLVVKGCLKVTSGIKAKSISGNGMISAGTISADSICADDVEAGTIICQCLVAKRVQTPELFASESAAVSSFLSASYVETGTLTVCVSELDQVKAVEIINLPSKKRSLFGTLLASALRSFWTALTVKPQRETVYDADYEVIEPEAEQVIQQPVEEVKEEPKEEFDEELSRFVGTFKLLRNHGYTLKVVAGTPEENAPKFDFNKECIIFSERAA